MKKLDLPGIGVLDFVTVQLDRFRRDTTDATFNRERDDYSTKLLKAYSNGQTFEKATITMPRDGDADSGRQFKIELVNATISSYAPGLDDSTSEQFTLNFVQMIADKDQYTEDY